ncbi:sulfatase family protein [Sediminicola luteus]|uniref:Arylsulfatase n=1 Tax=Sediminicola luteus TaxID=319238 RepID=A0A2A4GAL6_9FLAO|nr:arylsulfatase [Sediminicola luteus]PCE65999.1 arylsulfatase [Sediminicola luteus]
MQTFFKTLVFFTFCVVWHPATGQSDTPPNIIYVLADDLGIGDVAIFNADGKIQTPNLDRLATEGMRFTDAHTSSSVCTPTRYGILTGRYNWRSPLKQGVLTGISKALIPNSRTTVASLLKRKGYHTAFVGKWHLGWDWAVKEGLEASGSGWQPKDTDWIDFTKPITNGPKDLGFDYSYGHSGSLDMAPYVYVENGIPTQAPKKTTVDKGKYTWWRQGPTSDDFIHDQVTPHFFDKAISYIDQQEGKQPFFMYLALPSPHTPILPTAEWKGKSGLNPYADFVMQVDAHMGDLMAALTKKGMAENTLIIFTSDNGCSPQADYKVLAEKGHDPSAIYRGHKADIFEGGHRVPFIVRWPQRVAANSVSETVICTTDLMATVADIAGLELADTEGEDSFSMLPLLDTKAKGKYQRGSTIHHSINGSFALRKDEWKLVMCPGSGGWSAPKPNAKEIAELPEYQLYNLATDPGETENLFEKETRVAAKMTKELLRIINKGRSTPGSKQANDPKTDGKAWKQLEKISK